MSKAIQANDYGLAQEIEADFQRIDQLFQLSKHQSSRQGIIGIPDPAEAGYIDASECMAMGAYFYERMLSGGNQTGKTTTGAMEVAFHATGLYPDWWRGHRFTQPPTIWCGSEDFNTNIEGVQRYLMGEEAKGTVGMGFIPADKIKRIYRRSGGDGSYSQVAVQHTNGIARIRFFAYSKGREALQAGTVDFVWADEEPPMDIYAELVARTTKTKGLILVTYTPIKGLSPVTNLFLNDKTLEVFNDWPGRASMQVAA